MQPLQHRNTRTLALAVIAMLSVWMLISWQIAGKQYESDANALVQQETRLSQERAQDLTDSIRRNLKHLSGIPDLLANLELTQQTVARYGEEVQPSTLPYEERKARWTADPALNALSRYLALAEGSLNTDLIYVVNAAGDCIAASNWGTTGSSIGTNFAERDFFLANKTGRRGIQYAVGKTTHIPGLYYSSPIISRGHFLGAVVAKSDVPNLSFLTRQTDAYITDSNGVIILAHDKALEMRALPGALVASLPGQKRLERYQRHELTELAIASWPDPAFPSLIRFPDTSVPQVIVSKTLPEYGLTVHVKSALTAFPTLERNYIWFALSTGTLGGLLILIGAGAVFYVQSVRRAKHAIQASEEKLRGLYELSPLGISLTDRAGRFIEFNEAFRKICGYPADELRQLDYWTLTPREYEAQEARQLESLDATGHYGPYEKTYRQKDGSLIPIRLNGLLVSGKDDQQYIWSIVEDITSRKQHERQLEHIAHYDALTGIPNRVLLADRMRLAIAQMAREKCLMAVCYLDLDGFKPINDQLGHDAGDQVLIEVAKRIEATVRGGDTVARLGGDEFVVLLLGLQQREECLVILKRLLESVAQPIVVKHQTVDLSASIGVSIYPQDDEDADALLRHADQSMYLAKQSGKNCVHLYDPERDQRSRIHQTVLLEIKHGLDHGQFELYYQPKVDMRSRKLVGAEALIRWHHPERGLLAPGEFLRFIENTELDIEMGDWIVASALNQLAHWQRDGLNIGVSINISAHHLESSQFLDKIQLQLTRHPSLPAERLQIEVLESAALEDLDRVVTIIEAGHRIGIRFALDDFGTGYSSLTYLSHLPFDVLKIDQSFVRDMLEDKGTQAIVQGIITLAKVFGREIVAEGVETEEIFRALLEMGCETCQGYGIARPMPAAELSVWLASWKLKEPA